MKELDSVDKLYCKLCNYSAKQLTQHIKATHKLTVAQYREQFGSDCIMQIGFNPNKQKPTPKNSEYVRGGYDKIRDTLQSAIILDYDVLKCKLDAEFMREYDSGAQQRKLKRDAPNIIASINYYTTDLDKFANYKVGHLIKDRVRFIKEYDCKIESIKCLCGRKYSIDRTCRSCKGGIAYPSLGWFKHTYKTEYEEYYQIYLETRTINSNRAYSMVSQELFNSVIDMLDIDLRDAVYMGSNEWCLILNKAERLIASQNVYYLDFKLHNINIEFDSNKGRFPKTLNYMDIRDNLLKKHGFTVLRVEEYDYVRNRGTIIQKCIDFINDNIVIDAKTE